MFTAQTSIYMLAQSQPSLSTSVIRDLSLLLDSQLAMWQHIGKLTGLWYHHVRRLKKVRRILVSAFVSSWLDHCNLILASLSKSSIAHLQCVQNAVVRLVCDLSSCDQNLTWAILATNLVLHCVQVVPDDAQCPHRMQPWLHKGDSNANGRAA